MKQVTINTNPPEIIDLSRVHIPDLWHVAQWLQETDPARYRSLWDKSTRGLPRAIKEARAQQGKDIQAVWTLCHQLIDVLRAMPEPPEPGKGTADQIIQGAQEIKAAAVKLAALEEQGQ